MFIIDHSGSMREYAGGQSRLDRAKFELTRAIEALPPDSEFALLFYDSDIHLWRDELVVANEENKRKAIYFVSRLEYGSKTNTYGSLCRALEFDDDLEAVFLLTDGRPTAGAIIHPMAIVDDILHRNRFRHLNFNTIGIAVGRSNRIVSENAGRRIRRRVSLGELARKSHLSHRATPICGIPLHLLVPDSGMCVSPCPLAGGSDF